MQIRVVTPPAPFLTPADIPGEHAPNDVKLVAAIAAATSELDGYYGTLGRCIGPQTLELTLNCWSQRCIALPLAPIINFVSARIIAVDGAEYEAPSGHYRLSGDSLHLLSSWFGAAPSGWAGTVALVIQYRAGFALADGTPAVPEAIKRAVMLKAMNAGRISGMGSQVLRSETVEDVGQFVYLDPDKAAAAVQSEIDTLLSPFMVYRV